jgi:hypothetical protein
MQNPDDLCIAGVEVVDFDIKKATQLSEHLKHPFRPKGQCFIAILFGDLIRSSGFCMVFPDYLYARNAKRSNASAFLWAAKTAS